MGGFRCTYRNCSVRSDGQTHMFHYPVFDKLRCHQWLVNAQKLEFLDLKVSQLKNRVLCQHHFKDECFMNFKKDKLKFDAVPTENGPFCDASDEADVKKYSITLEDIEKEILSSKEKKANFSLKYGDFLTNGELAHFSNLAIEGDINIKEKDESNLIFPYFELDEKLTSSPKKIRKAKQIKAQPPLSKETETFEITPFYDNLKICSQNTNNINQGGDKKINIIAEKQISSPFTIKGELKPLSPSAKIQLPRKKEAHLTDGDGSYVIIENPPKSQGGKNRNVVLFEDPQRSEELHSNYVILDKTNSAEQNANGNIVIIENPSTLNSDSVNIHIDPCPFTSEANITTSIDSKLESILPKCENITPKTQPPQACKNVDNGLQKALPDPSLTLLTMDDITKLLNDPQQTSQKPLTTGSKIEQCVNEKHLNNKISTNASFKNKMPPERIAAIEHKRKINKQKLRDMIDFFLDEIDCQDKKAGEKSRSPTKEHKETRVGKAFETNRTEVTDNAKNVLVGQPRLQSLEEYTIASLESRIQKLEETLSRKIDQNTQRISELKSLLPQQKSKNKSIGMQTKNISENEESCKKRLFNEISIYLSPDTNSLIYEELFINKLVKNVGKAVSSKSESLEYITRAKRQKRSKV